MINILTDKRLSVSSVKSTLGREGDGVNFCIKLSGKVLCTYSDYGDGAPADINYPSPEAKATMFKLLEPHLLDIIDDHLNELKHQDKTFNFMIESLTMEREALATNKDVEYKSAFDRVNKKTPDQARYSVIEHWVFNQLLIHDRVKLCKKKTVFSRSDKPGATFEVAEPFSIELKNQILAAHSVSASNFEFFNETYGIYPTQSDLFKFFHEPRLKKLQTCLVVVFREKDGVHDGDVGINEKTKWRQLVVSPQNLIGKEAAIAKLKAKHGDKLELLEPLLLNMKAEAARADQRALSVESIGPNP